MISFVLTKHCHTLSDFSLSSKKWLAALQARDKELDELFERIYEDNVSGKISDDRFSKMSRQYEEEQKEISDRINTIHTEMDKLSSKAVTADMFISTVRKYKKGRSRKLRTLPDRYIKKASVLRHFKCCKNTRHGAGNRT